MKNTSKIYLICNSLNLGRKLIGIQIKYSMVYKIEFWFGIVALLMKMIMVCSLWNCLYSNSYVTADYMQLDKMLLYSILGIGFNEVFNVSVTKKINSYISNGDISIRLLQPVMLQTRCFWESIGIMINSLIFRFSIVFLLLFFCLD